MYILVSSALQPVEWTAVNVEDLRQKCTDSTLGKSTLAIDSAMDWTEFGFIETPLPKWQGSLDLK